MEDNINNLIIAMLGILICLLVDPKPVIFLFAYGFVIFTIFTLLKIIIQWIINLLIH